MKKKIRKIGLLSLAAIVVAVLAFVSCAGENAVLDHDKTYEITSDIHSLQIQIHAADFKIKVGDAFSVTSNLKYLSVSEQDGVLTLVDEADSHSRYSDAVLTLYVPSGIVFDEVAITTGAAKMTVDALSAGTLSLTLGAGDVLIESLHASSGADIQGGAGKITVASGTLHDLTMEMGVGELNLHAALPGNSDLEFGVGESNVTLLGGKDDYTVEIEKGLGSITVDGKKVSDFDSSGNGQNQVHIKGGVGTINIAFQEE